MEVLLSHPLVIPGLVFLTVLALGSAVIVTRAGRRRTLQDRLLDGLDDGSASMTMLAPATPRLTNTLERVGKKVSADGAHNLREKLTQAGYYNQSAVTVYMGAQLLLFVLGLAISLLAILPLDIQLALKVCLMLIPTGLLSLLPNVVVSQQQRHRTAEVRRALPDAIDLLEICVSAGMGLDMAWNAVADQIRAVSALLADEMALTNMEIHLGAPRIEALRNMAKRTGAPELSSLVAVLVQSERFGTSVSQALRGYAEDLRAERSQRAQEQAEKLAVKLLFPMLLFIFPVLLLVILGPAGIKVYAALNKF